MKFIGLPRICRFILFVFEIVGCFWLCSWKSVWTLLEDGFKYFDLFKNIDENGIYIVSSRP